MTPCPNCGHVPTMQTTYCPQCGSTMPSGATAAPPPPTPPPTPGMQQQPGPAAQPPPGPGPQTMPPPGPAPSEQYFSASSAYDAGDHGMPPNAGVAIALAILCFFCCWPAAIGSLITAILGMNAGSAGDVPRAKTLIKTSYIISGVSIGLFMLLMIFYFCLG